MDNIKVSVIFICLDSHEIVERQIKYMNQLGIPNWMEVIIVDDGSIPLLHPTTKSNFKLLFVRTCNYKPYTMASARNKGVEYANGDYFLFIDIDHMLSKEFIEFAKDSKEHYVRFYRIYALLDRNGNLIELEEAPYGPHPNGWVSREVFDEVGRFDENTDGRLLTGVIPKDDTDLKYKLYKYRFKKRYEVIKTDKLYMFPEKGDKRRPDLFHNLYKIYGR